MLRGVASRMPRGAPMLNQPTPGFRGQQRPQPYQQQQQVIEHDENLSDKEIFPSANRHDQHAAQVNMHFVSTYCVLIKIYNWYCKNYRLQMIL